MSKFVKVQTELREAVYICRALEDLKLEYREGVTWVHRFSHNQRANAIAVNAKGANFAFAPFQGDENAGFELLFDDMQKKAVEALVGRIRQRYAYHKVVAETRAAGFELVEERTGADDVVRLTVRRWA